MATFLENREIELAKSEKEHINNALNSSKEIYANKLKNGLGNRIKNELKNPTKPKKVEKAKFKLTRYFSRLFFNLKNAITGTNINYYDTESE